jgi:predicted outer membrane protein
MVADHVTALVLFESGHDLGNNKTLKGFAAGKLPALEMHLQEAQSLAAGYP